MKKILILSLAIFTFAAIKPVEVKAQTSFRGITFQTSLVTIGDSLFLSPKKHFALYVDSIAAVSSTHAITDTTKFFLPASPDSGTTFLFNATVGDSTPIVIVPASGQKINNASGLSRLLSYTPKWLTWVGGFAGWLGY